MELVFGFDIGTTSIGFAAIEFDAASRQGRIIRIGSRIFPEARDVDGTPLNQTRRTKRMMRRQLRRRKMRRQELNRALADAGLLPVHKSEAWDQLMLMDPLELRAKALREPLSTYELGRALSHLAKRRHFRGKDLEETEDGSSLDGEETSLSPADAAELGIRQRTIATLAATGETLGQHLASRGKDARKRGVHALRSHVEREFQAIWAQQSEYHPDILTESARDHLYDIVFAQRPVFWRMNTLGDCRLEPGAPLLPKGSWQSAQRRMLEKLNSLRIEGGNGRPLSEVERTAILSKLQTQQAMTFPAIRKVLEPMFQADGLSTKYIKFNLENGGETKIPGNPIESKLATIFGEAWDGHPHKQAIRETVYDRIGKADYGQIGNQRVVILRTADRLKSRAAAVASYAKDFNLDDTIVSKLMELSFPTGWDAFSASAVAKLLPELERGVMMGQLLASPDWADWRHATFPNREQPTGEILDRLPSPANKDERARQTRLRNPTVVRVQNELRKVVNNLIDFCGRKPDIIRLELARDVGLGKNEREEKTKGMRQAEKRRSAARADLISKGFPEPAHRDIEKWILWKECQETCPYTGDSISFDALFRTSDFEVEHIWPRSRSLDDSQANKTLCRKDVNIAKGNKTPFEFFKSKPEEWDDVKTRLWKMQASKGKDGMGTGKIKRFLKEELPDDFASRQLNDTGYAARQAMEQLKRLWPDVGPEGRVYVQPVNGKVTAHLRKYWELNHILGDTGEKNRADHRHHAIDALVVACAHPGTTQRLSAYWQAKDDPRSAGPEKPQLNPPWPTIRADAAQAANEIVVSHRVRKKVSGPLHEGMIYGGTGKVVTKAKTEYLQLVKTIAVEDLSLKQRRNVRDPRVREILEDWISQNGGDPKKAFKTFPRVSPEGPEIRRVRVIVERQECLLASVSTGFAPLGNNHHISIYRLSNGKYDFKITSLFEASKRVSRREMPVPRNEIEDGIFVMSLALDDQIWISEGERTGYWRVNRLSANGQTFLVRANDASAEKETEWGPNPNSLMAEGAKKISVDPIGRIRPAND